MKRSLIFLYFSISCILIGCGKKNDPTPSPTPTPTQTATLAITDFNPKTGPVGTTVMFTGTAFGTDTNAVSITFSGAAGIKPKSISATTMSVIVPANAQTGKIQITEGTNTVTTADDFTVTKTAQPLVTINGFSPTTAKVGDLITVTGTAFGTDTNFVAVSFGGSKTAKPKTISATSMTVTVPADAKTGKIQVVVNSATPVQSASDLIISVSAPTLTITGISPSTVTQGDTIIITGTQFGTSTSSVLVYLNRGSGDLGTTPISVTPTKISVIVPSNAVSGNIKLFVQGLGSITSTQTFTFVPITLLGQITPTSARAGEIIQINGGFYPADDLNSITIKFAGSSVLGHPLAIDIHSNMSVRVPLDAQSGFIKVTKTGFATAKSASSFTVLPPMPPVQSGTWTQRPDFLSIGYPGGGRAGAFAFTVDNKAYVGTGTTNAPFDGYAMSDVWQYDPVYNSWMQVADFGGGIRKNAVAFSIGHKGYAGIGTNPNTMSDFWEYDPTANTWTQKTDFKGGARTSATGFAIGNYGYIGTGSSGTNTYNNDFYQYNPASNSWNQIASMPGVRLQPYSFVIGNQAFVGGGDVGLSTPNIDLYMYDPVANAWTAEAPIPNYNYTSFNASFTIANKAYVGLGIGYINGASTSTDQVFEYTPATNSWKSLPSFGGGARYSAVGFAIGNIGYFGMGETATYATAYKDFWAYTP